MDRQNFDELGSGRIEIHQDVVAEALDEMADLCEHWKRNREKGRIPVAIRSALLMLAEECVLFMRAKRKDGEKISLK